MIDFLNSLPDIECLYVLFFALIFNAILMFTSFVLNLVFEILDIKGIYKSSFRFDTKTTARIYAERFFEKHETN